MIFHKATGCRWKIQGQVFRKPRHESRCPRDLLKAIHLTVPVLVCPPECRGKTQLLKTPRILVTGHGGIKLALTRSVLPSGQLSQRQKKWCQLLVWEGGSSAVFPAESPVDYSDDQCGQRTHSTTGAWQNVIFIFNWETLLQYTVFIFLYIIFLAQTKNILYVSIYGLFF